MNGVIAGGKSGGLNMLRDLLSKGLRGQLPPPSTIWNYAPAPDLALPQAAPPQPRPCKVRITNGRCVWSTSVCRHVDRGPVIQIPCVKNCFEQTFQLIHPYCVKKCFEQTFQLIQISCIKKCSGLFSLFRFLALKNVFNKFSKLYRLVIYFASWKMFWLRNKLTVKQR